MVILCDQMLFPAIAEDPDRIRLPDQAVVGRPAALADRRMDAGHVVEQTREQHRRGILLMRQASVAGRSGNQQDFARRRTGAGAKKGQRGNDCRRDSGSRHVQI